MATVGSWRDTLSDDEVLADLRRCNRGNRLAQKSLLLGDFRRGGLRFLFPKSLGKLTVFQTSFPTQQSFQVRPSFETIATCRREFRTSFGFEEVYGAQIGDT
jgi:hypothetical protein